MVEPMKDNNRERIPHDQEARASMNDEFPLVEKGKEALSSQKPPFNEDLYEMLRSYR